MEISFTDNKLCKLCENEKTLRKKYGKEMVKKLQNRLRDLLAAPCITDLPYGKPHPLKGSRKGQLSITIHQGLRLIVKPANHPVPKDQEGNVLWDKVTMICIIGIEDYHD